MSTESTDYGSEAGRVYRVRMGLGRSAYAVKLIGADSWAIGGNAFAGKFALGGVRSCQSSVIAMMNDKLHEEHEDENGAESDHNGCAGRRIHLDAEPAAQRGDDRAHGPANGEPQTDTIGKQHRDRADDWN